MGLELVFSFAPYYGGSQWHVPYLLGVVSHVSFLALGYPLSFVNMRIPSTSCSSTCRVLPLPRLLIYLIIRHLSRGFFPILHTLRNVILSSTFLRTRSWEDIFKSSPWSSSSVFGGRYRSRIWGYLHLSLPGVLRSTYMDLCIFRILYIPIHDITSTVTFYI